MAAHPTTTGESIAARPFDDRLSAHLEFIQIELDDLALDPRPRRTRRWWLRQRKRYYERSLPPAIAPCCRCGDALGCQPVDPDGSAFCELCWEAQR